MSVKTRNSNVMKKNFISSFVRLLMIDVDCLRFIWTFWTRCKHLKVTSILSQCSRSARSCLEWQYLVRRLAGIRWGSYCRLIKIFLLIWKVFSKWAKNQKSCYLKLCRAGAQTRLKCSKTKGVCLNMIECILVHFL